MSVVGAACHPRGNRQAARTCLMNLCAQETRLVQCGCQFPVRHEMYLLCHRVRVTPQSAPAHAGRSPFVAYLHRVSELSQTVAYKGSEAVGRPYSNLLPCLLSLAYRIGSSLHCLEPSYRDKHTWQTLAEPRRPRLPQCHGHTLPPTALLFSAQLQLRLGSWTRCGS